MNERDLEIQKSLTKDQKMFICYQIGEWYVKWADSITDSGTPHWLGLAKEELKNFICGDKV